MEEYYRARWNYLLARRSQLYSRVFNSPPPPPAPVPPPTPAAPAAAPITGGQQPTMPPPAAFITLTEAPRSVQLFKINGFTASGEKPECSIASTRTSVAGYDWEIDYHPAVVFSNEPWVKFRVTFASDAAANDDGGGQLVASFTGRLVDPAGELAPSQLTPMSTKVFRKGQARDLFVMARKKLASSGFVRDDSFLVELVITVLLDKPRKEAAAAAAMAASVAVAEPSSSSDLRSHFGELWRSQKGTDVTFVVSGEPIAAHRCVLAARSPVFMAELFGEMKEKASSQSVVIEDMEPEVFRALMHFIYTDDTSPELEEEEDAMAMAQHLLAAADRYGMERLKLICEEKVCGDISVGTAATHLVLAEQHGCPKLKARCMEFMVATPANLRAVVKTEGYRHLMASCPSVLSDLLEAVVERNR